jgi:hypothetical protein
MLGMPWLCCTPDVELKDNDGNVGEGEVSEDDPTLE